MAGYRPSSAQRQNIQEGAQTFKNNICGRSRHMPAYWVLFNFMSTKPNPMPGSEQMLNKHLSNKPMNEKTLCSGISSLLEEGMVVRGVLSIAWQPHLWSWAAEDSRGSYFERSPSGSTGKEPSAKAGDVGLIPGWGRCPGEGNGNPLQYSCLENPMDRGTWQATVHEAPHPTTWTHCRVSLKRTLSRHENPLKLCP